MTRRASITLTGLTTILSFATATDALRWGFKHNIDKAIPRHQHARRQGSSEQSLPVVSQPSLPTGSGELPSSSSAFPTIGIPSPSLLNDSMPIFPSETVQEAIATVCPGQPADSGIFTMMPVPTQTLQATAVLPDGSMTTFASTAGPAVSARQAPAASSAAAGDARIAVDSNGCQTLFAPRVYCSTTISPVGIPEVTISDCEQWVTFSSETKICPTVSMPTVITTLPPVPMPTTPESATGRNTMVEGPASPSDGSVPAEGGVGAVPPSADAVEPSAPPSVASDASDDGETAAAAATSAPPPAEPPASAAATSAPPPAESPASAVETSNLLASSSPPESPSSSIPVLSISVLPEPESSAAASSAEPSQPPAAAPSSQPSSPATSDTSDPSDSPQQPQRRQAQPSSPVSAAASVAILPPPSNDYTAPGTYYLAHWYDVARGGVPQQVRAVECEAASGSGGAGGASQDCSTWSERWSVTSVLRSVTETRPVTYSGPVVITDGTLTYTTTISIATVTTTTKITASPQVVKQRLSSDPTAVPGQFAADAADSTVTMTGTVTQTHTAVQTRLDGVVTMTVGGGVQTISLEAGGGS